MATIVNPSHAQDAYRYAMQHHPDLVHDRNFLQQITAERRPVLTVSDIERLAKAGVTISLSDLQRHEVVSDPVEPVDMMQEQKPTPLVDMIYARMNMAARARRGNQDVYGGFSEAARYPEMYATPYGDKVFVLVATGYSEPIIIQDDAQMFPSDALLAKLALLKDTEKMNGARNEQEGVRGTAGVASAPQTTRLPPHIQNYAPNAPIPKL